MKNFLRKKDRQILNFEHLEDRCVPAVYEFVTAGGANGQDWNSLGNWQIGGNVALNLPGANDEVVLDSTDTVKFNNNVNTTIKKLEMKGGPNNNPTLYMGHAGATGKQLIVTNDAIFSDGHIIWTTGPNDPPSSGLTLKGASEFKGTSFVDQSAVFSPQATVHITGGGTAKVTESTFFQVYLVVGDLNPANGAPKSSFVVDGGDLNLDKHGILVGRSGVLTVKDGAVKKNIANNNTLDNFGLLRLNPAPNKTAVIKLEINNFPDSKTEGFGKGKMQPTAMNFQAGSALYVWGGAELDVLTVAEGGTGGGLTFDTGSQFHFLPSADGTTVTIDGSVMMNGDANFYNNLFTTPTDYEFNLASSKTSVHANSILNVVSDSWASSSWTQNGSMNFDVFYDQPTTTVFNTKLVVEDNFYGNGALNVTTDFNGTTVDNTAVVHLVEGDNLVDNFLSTNYFGPFVGWNKSFSSTAFDLVVNGGGGVLVEEEIIP